MDNFGFINLEIFATFNLGFIFKNLIPKAFLKIKKYLQEKETKRRIEKLINLNKIYKSLLGVGREK